MKAFAKFFDFVYGTFLIGGAPLCVLFVPMLITDIVSLFLKFTIPDVTLMILVGLLMVTAIGAFVAAVLYRAYHRNTPRLLEVVEIIFGVLWALWFFGYYALYEHTLYDWP
jgi:hypothetical protein